VADRIRKEWIITSTTSAVHPVTYKLMGFFEDTLV
jgi:hypothetical protein